MSPTVSGLEPPGAPPAATSPAEEGRARSHRLVVRLSLASRSRASFSSLAIGNPARKPKAPVRVPFPSSRSTLRNIVYSSGLSVARSWLGFYPLHTLVPDTACPGPFGSPAPRPDLCDFPHPAVPGSSGLPSPAPSGSGQSHPWVGVARGLWPRIPHPGRQFQGSKRAGPRVRTWQLRSGCSAHPTQEDEKAQRAQCVDWLVWG